MRPSNDRELAIARTIDKIAIEGKLDLTAIDDAATTLGFSMIHRSDRKYLERYIEWRIENPLLK